jgi:hypothetical protein
MAWSGYWAKVRTSERLVLYAGVKLLVDTTDRRPLEKLDKLKVAIAEYGPEADYYMGTAGSNYMGFDSVPGHRVYVQEKRKEVSPHSIVQLIATETHPEQVVDASWAWRGREGDLHMVVGGKRRTV